MKTKTQDSLKIAFAGGGPFALPIFKALTENYGDLTLLTKRDKPKGRGGKVTISPIKQMAQKNNVPIFEPKNKLEMEEMVAKIKPNIVIVASLGIIITQETLDMPKYGFLNVHFSLLPLHRGSCPVQATILAGDKKAGITIQKMAAEVDAGDVVSQFAINLGGRETTMSLGKELSNLAAEKVIDVIGSYTSGTITPQRQDHSQATFTKMIQKTDGAIDWSESAENIERKVRAYTPWPGTYTYWNKKLLKVIEANATNEKSDEKPGTFVDLGNKEYGVQTGNGVLVLKKVQLEGKKPLVTSDFIIGNNSIIGNILV